MLIYFDESYDREHNYLILGALFNPHPTFLHRKLLALKHKYTFYDKNGVPGELKYYLCNNKYKLDLSCEAIDIFIKSTSYFRCIVVDQSVLNLDYFGQKHEDNKIKMARAYKKFAEMLIAHNTENIYNGVLLTDELTRCEGDRFIEIMKEDFCLPDGKYCDMPNRPTLKHVKDIKSHIVDYHVCQINDLLIGCVLNNLVPTTKSYKNDLRKHLIKSLDVPDLLPQTWGGFSRSGAEAEYPKFNIQYWKPIIK